MVEEGFLSFIPLSTRPHRVRRSNIPKEIIDFIRALRREHPGSGKEKIKPLLDKYCKEKGMRSVSESTIGNIAQGAQILLSEE